MDTPELIGLIARAPGAVRELAPPYEHLDSDQSCPEMPQFLLLAIRIVVSLALFYLALRGINFAALQSRLSQINLI